MEYVIVGKHKFKYIVGLVQETILPTFLDVFSKLMNKVNYVMYDKSIDDVLST